MLKKISIVFFSVLMLFCITSTAFAAQTVSNQSSILKLPKPNASVNLWPGDKIPQVSSLEFYDIGTLANGHAAIILKVMGYGNENTIFNGNRIWAIQQVPIVLSGTGADGFLYIYDLGELKPGSYSFKTTFTSREYPYTQQFYYDTITVTE
ncbi:hypothetical protein [Lacrimispora sp. JR3]|uniref:hypothetical protein n=1 Tax=Lacrimispora sinapis TaxID=3111456 RepID=UPI0037492AAD